MASSDAAVASVGFAAAWFGHRPPAPSPHIPCRLPAAAARRYIRIHATLSARDVPMHAPEPIQDHPKLNISCGTQCHVAALFYRQVSSSAGLLQHPPIPSKTNNLSGLTKDLLSLRNFPPLPKPSCTALAPQPTDPASCSGHACCASHTFAPSCSYWTSTLHICNCRPQLTNETAVLLPWRHCPVLLHCRSCLA